MRKREFFPKILPCDTGAGDNETFLKWMDAKFFSRRRVKICGPAKKKIKSCQMGAADFRLSTISSHALTLIWYNALGWSILPLFFQQIFLLQDVKVLFLSIFFYIHMIFELRNTLYFLRGMFAYRKNFIWRFINM